MAKERPGCWRLLAQGICEEDAASLSLVICGLGRAPHVLLTSGSDTSRIAGSQNMQQWSLELNEHCITPASHFLRDAALPLSVAVMTSLSSYSCKKFSSLLRASQLQQGSQSDLQRLFISFVYAVIVRTAVLGQYARVTNHKSESHAKLNPHQVRSFLTSTKDP